MNYELRDFAHAMPTADLIDRIEKRLNRTTQMQLAVWLGEVRDDGARAEWERQSPRFVVMQEMINILYGALTDLLEAAERTDEELTGPADRCYFSPALLSKCRAALKGRTPDTP